MRPMFLVACTLLVAEPAWAQDFGLSWFTVDGGGATFSTGGPFSLGATIGQPDASNTLTGGSFSLVGGFWGVTSSSVQADLSVTKTDGRATVIPGQTITYTIVVSNAGPSGAIGATVTDTVPAAITGATWTCAGSGGGACTASGAGNINDTVTLPQGASVTYTLTGTVSPTATGSLTNTATVAAPGGVVDPNPANNSATDTDGLASQADLAVTKTDGQAATTLGAPVTYTIVASNAGPSAANGATVTDTLPAAITGAIWTCVGAGGATCTPGPVNGHINDTVNLPVGGSVTYTLTGTVSVTATIPFSNTASVAPPGGVVDPNSANDSATDVDTILFACGAEIVIVPDGRLTESAIPAGATRWFGASVSIGNSYSVEFKNTSGTSTPPGTLTLFAGDDACGGTSTVVTNPTSGIDPGGTGATARVSFTAGGTLTFFRAKLANASGSPVPFSFTWSDTTMFSPAWSDNGSFDTFYSFQNTTGATLNGMLTLLDPGGAVVTTLGLTIAPGQAASTNTAALGIARNRTGTARFTHNGPPGAILAEAAISNFSISPAYVQPVKFQAMREAR